MLKTVAYIPEHGYDTEDHLKTTFKETQTQTAEMWKTLCSPEKRLREINELIHYTGQYLTNKLLKAEKEKYEAYRNLREYEKKLHIIQTNLDTFLGKDCSRQTVQEKESTLS